MPFPVRPEWSTASVGSSHAPTDAVDHSAPSAIRPESTYISGKVVQTNGATSLRQPATHSDGLAAIPAFGDRSAGSSARTRYQGANGASGRTATIDSDHGLASVRKRIDPKSSPAFGMPVAT